MNDDRDVRKVETITWDPYKNAVAYDLKLWQETMSRTTFERITVHRKGARCVVFSENKESLFDLTALERLPYIGQLDKR
ncbi:hypothetical protein AB0892_08050 [Streptomyces sp. NPDC005409]|uniref:hypothetical protein n=1 Tax=Streptomyces sp. NPDC005409 TaxID=3155342 RepID=UPI003456299F